MFHLQTNDYVLGIVTRSFWHLGGGAEAQVYTGYPYDAFTSYHVQVVSLGGLVAILEG